MGWLEISNDSIVGPPADRRTGGNHETCVQDIDDRPHNFFDARKSWTHPQERQT